MSKNRETVLGSKYTVLAWACSINNLFHCQVIDLPPLYTTKRTVREMQNGFKVYFPCCRLSDVPGNEVAIPSSTLEDSGTYQCFAYNLAGFAVSAALVSIMSE